MKPWTLTNEADTEIDEELIFALVAKALGENWTTKSSHQLRLGNDHYKELSPLVFLDGKLVGTTRLWPIIAGMAGPALLLGPLAVEPDLHGQGIGLAILKYAIERAGQAGHGGIVLVGDAPYYERAGFSSKPLWAMRMPGRYDQNRLLGIELIEGYLTSKDGVITR